MRQRTLWLSGLGVGAAVAFLLDPISGNRRRHRILDAVVHATHKTLAGLSAIQRDVTNRTRGVISSTRGRIESPTADDVILEERVRAALGHVMPHPHAITVRACDGTVILDALFRRARNIASSTRCEPL